MTHILAQVPFTDGLTSSGPAWTLVAILLTLCWLLIKMLLTEKDKRIDDANKNKEDIVQPINNISKTLERIEEKTLVAKRGR